MLGRLVTPAGTFDGTTFQIAATGDAETPARVEADDAGRGIVFWARDRGGTDGYDVYGHWLGSDGNPAGDPFVIQQAVGNQQAPAAAGDDQGRFLVVWEDDRNGNWDIYGTRYERLQASFTATPTQGIPPLPVHFAAGSTPSGEAESWSWSFGTGDTSAAQNPVYTYMVPGQYTVTLNITDTDSCETAGLTRSNFITVTPPTVISYTYDSLYRLTDADYSSGERFEYDYDKVGNRTAMTATITSTQVTTYTYDAANRLVTARADDSGVVWYYTFDKRGYLVRQTPGSTEPTEGETRYNYDVAGHLVLVELYVGGEYTPLAAATYNGDGERVRLTTWAEGVPMAVTYTVVEGQLLEMDNGSQSSLYLHGKGLITEQGEGGWAYYLYDNVGSVRQIVNGSGVVVLMRTYKPFGSTLEEGGLYDTEFGFLGAQFDYINGLIYIDGRYYDPVTGRFLTPKLVDKSGGASPYSPWQNVPTLLLAPLLVGVVFSIHKRGVRGKDYWLFVLMVCICTSLTTCSPTPTSTPLPPSPTIPPQPPTQTPRPLPTDWFSDMYGEAIARRARELVELSSRNEIQVIRDMSSCWDIEDLGIVTEYVCADVVTDAYYAAGINLQQLLLSSEVSSNWPYSCAAIHNSQAFKQYLEATGQLRLGSDFPFYQGEIVIGYPDWAHAAIVVEGGYDENSVRLVQASYSRMAIEETTLADWKSRGPGIYVWHGHPSLEELNRVAP